MSRSFGWVEVHAVDHCNNHCDSCHNYSPFAPRRNYAAEEYFDGLDILTLNKVNYVTISIMGGEPFLHPDLTAFADALQRRYAKYLICTTNCFWLSEEDIDHYEPLWRLLTTLTVSVYPNIVKKLGGMDRFKELLQYLKSRYPRLHVHMPDKFVFRRLSFYEEPEPVTLHCPNAECTCLLPDARLARCGAGAFQHFSQTTSAGFAASQDMFYDLNAFDWQSFWFWRKRYPLDACSYCGLSKLEQINWKVQRGMPYRHDLEAEYDVRIAEEMYRMGKVDKALARLMRTVERYPDCKEAHNDLGVIWSGLGRIAYACSSLERALELDPSFFAAQENLAAIRHPK